MSGSGSCNQVSESLPKEDTGNRRIGEGKWNKREKASGLNHHIITIIFAIEAAGALGRLLDVCPVIMTRG